MTSTPVTAPETTAPVTDPPAAPEPPTGTTPPAGDPPAGDDGALPGDLGDAGKKAIDAMKAERNTARQEAATLREQLAVAEAKANGTLAEYEASKATQVVRDEALAKAKVSVLEANVRAAAADKLADPQDALLHLDLSSFEVGDDFTVDTAAVSAAITDLTTRKPYLAAQGGSGFVGAVDQGTRNGNPKSIGDQIADAEKAKDFQTSSALKAQMLVDMSNSRTP